MNYKTLFPKKMLSILLAICLLLFSVPFTAIAATAPTDQWSNHAADSFAGGTGTKTDPYQIATAAQLSKLAKDVNGGNAYKGVYFKLTDDIDLSAYRWNPIGVYFWDLDNTAVSKPFAGILDGNEKSITGLYVDERSSCSAAGLFGEIRGTAGDISVYDLTIEDAVIYAADASGMGIYAGVFVGMATADDIDGISFENINVSGKIICEADYGCVVAGGMVGYAERGHFTSCIADSVYLSGSGNMGGFVGMDGESLFKNCVAKGENSGLWAVGGFSGYSWDATGTGGDDIVQSTFDHCYADVDVTAADWRAGGFVGFAEGGKFNNCVAMGDVKSSVSEWEPKIGGFVGEMISATMDKCHVGGVVSSSHQTSEAGGFIGYDASGTVGAVTASSFDSEINPALNAVGVVEASGQHTITGTSSKNVITNICKDYYGNKNHKYDDSADLTCDSCGFTRLPGEVRIHDIDLVNGDDDHTLALGNGTAVYDPKTQTVTLTNAQITVPSGNVDAGIYFSGFSSDVTIKLVGENTIHLTDSANDNLGIWNYSKYGLHIEGTGSLEVMLFGGTYGIMNRDGDVHIEDATLSFELLDGSVTNGFLIDSSYSVSLNNATLSADGFMMGIFGEESVAIEKSDVTLNVLESGVYSEGDITIKDSELTFTGAYEGLCAWGQTVVVDSDLNLKSEWSNAIYSYGPLEISGGDVTLVAQDNTAAYVNGGIVIDGDAVVEIDGQNGYGIYTDEIVNIKSGTVSVKGSARAICATRVSANDLSTKPTDSPVALVIGEGYAEENGYTIDTSDWEVRTVWDSWLFEEVDKWQSLSYFADADGNKVKEISIVASEDVTITENTEKTTVTYDGSEIDLSLLFNIDSNTGAATYTVTNGTGEGTVEDDKLTVTKAGTFQVKVDTAPVGKYATGTCTVTLTVKPAVITITVDNKTINQYDALPVLSELTYTVKGLLGNDELVVKPTLAFGVENADTAGTFTITASGADAGSNYTISYVAGTLTVAAHTEHIGGTATCTEKAKCSVCTNEYGDTLPHTYGTEWKSDGTNHWHECSCGSKTEEAAHNGGTITCKDKAVCSVCGTVYGKLAAHNYKDGKCTVCEATDPNYVPETDSPQTGDNSNLWLWFALLFISGGAVIALTVVDRKKRSVANK